MMMDSVAVPEVDALMYVVLNKAEKIVPYGDLLGTRECIMLQTRCCTNTIVITQFNCNWTTSIPCMEFSVCCRILESVFCAL